MVKTGVLRIENNTGISRLDSGSESKRLAKHGPGDPFGNATDFLVSERGLGNGDLIWATGDNGSASGVPVFFITDAGLAEQAVAVLSAAEIGGSEIAVTAGASAAPTASRKTASRGGKSGSARKGSSKKSAGKKGGTKSSTKRGAAKKGSTKKSRDAGSRKGSKKRS